MNNKVILGLPLSLVIASCASTTWYKPGATENDFRMDSYRCESFAKGVAPMPRPTASYPSSSTTYSSGNIYGSSGSAYYSGTSTTYYDNSAEQLSNSFASLGAALKQRRVHDDCMISLGYSQKKTQEQSSDRFSGKLPESVSSKLPDMNEKETEVGLVKPILKHLPQNLYKEQSSASDVVYTVRSDTPLKVISETEGMYKVEAEDGKTGWIGKIWVDVHEVSSFVNASNEGTYTGRDPDTPVVWPNASMLPSSLYREPSEESSISYTLRHPRSLYVIKEKDNMYLVKDSDDHWGWIKKSLVID